MTSESRRGRRGVERGKKNKKHPLSSHPTTTPEESSAPSSRDVRKRKGGEGGCDGNRDFSPSWSVSFERARFNRRPGNVPELTKPNDPMSHAPLRLRRHVEPMFAKTPAFSPSLLDEANKVWSPPALTSLFQKCPARVCR